MRWRTSVSPVLSSAANLWRLALSREINAILYPALEKRRLVAANDQLCIVGDSGDSDIRRGTSCTRGVPKTGDNKDGASSGHDSCDATAFHNAPLTSYTVENCGNSSSSSSQSAGSLRALRSALSLGDKRGKKSLMWQISPRDLIWPGPCGLWHHIPALFKRRPPSLSLHGTPAS
jgi:hypothetical protein